MGNGFERHTLADTARESRGNDMSTASDTRILAPITPSGGCLSTRRYLCEERASS